MCPWCNVLVPISSFYEHSLDCGNIIATRKNTSSVPRPLINKTPNRDRFIIPKKKETPQWRPKDLMEQEKYEEITTCVMCGLRKSKGELAIHASFCRQKNLQTKTRASMRDYFVKCEKCTKMWSFLLIESHRNECNGIRFRQLDTSTPEIERIECIICKKKFAPTILEKHVNDCLDTFYREPKRITPTPINVDSDTDIIPIEFDDIPIEFDDPEPMVILPDISLRNVKDAPRTIIPENAYKFEGHTNIPRKYDDANSKKAIRKFKRIIKKYHPDIERKPKERDEATDMPAIIPHSEIWTSCKICGIGILDSQLQVHTSTCKMPIHDDVKEPKLHQLTIRDTILHIENNQCNMCKKAFPTNQDIVGHNIPCMDTNTMELRNTLLLNGIVCATRYYSRILEIFQLVPVYAVNGTRIYWPDVVSEINLYPVRLFFFVLISKRITTATQTALSA